MAAPAHRRTILLRELVLALAVIAIVFLNFGHTSVSASGEIRIVPDSWCGDPMAPDAPAHAPCHACRVDGAALPPPPVAVIPVAFDHAPAAYAAPEPRSQVPIALRPALPRGPPASV